MSYRAAGLKVTKKTCSNAIRPPRSSTAEDNAASWMNSASALFEIRDPIFTQPQGPKNTRGNEFLQAATFFLAASSAQNPRETTTGSDKSIRAPLTSCSASIRGLNFPPVLTRCASNIDSTNPVNPSGAPSIPRLAAQTFMSTHASSKCSATLAAF
eukprot:30957-Pelagococcus_subviridis.AAC.7